MNEQTVILKNLLLKLEKLERQVDKIHQPIAIIGMGCRFPGGAENPQQFWGLLQAGFDSSMVVPRERWNIDDYYDPNPDIAGKIISNKSSFLTSSVKDFDAEFFGISPREAEYLDPQQRLLLEVTWEALENAAIEPRSLKQSLSGVFIGISTHDYAELLEQALSKSAIDAYLATGNAASAATGRISYILGLQGPSVALDTACSSSLVALHQACLSLRNGDSDLAIAGGVNVLLSPTLSVDFSQAHMLAADGHCKTFDKEADGYVRGEGCGIVILKRLSEAQRDKDRILGVIKGSAVNQDGPSSGLTVPNGPAQEALIQRALQQAQLLPHAIDYIEAHGTGTALGDPIEVNALRNVFGNSREEPLTIGTVKTNIGHLEAAAGIAGVIKTLLALQHEEIPKHLHFKQLNPHIIDFTQIPARLPLDPIPWKKQANHIRRAGISSFGFSGTNAHIILEEAPDQDLTQMKQPISPTIFNRRCYWAEVLNHKSWYGFWGEEAHPLLGIRLPEIFNLTSVIYEKHLNLDEFSLSYLRDHQVFQHILYPGSGFVELLLAAAHTNNFNDKIILKELSIERPLALYSAEIKVQVALEGERLSVYSKSIEGDWLLHAQANFTFEQEPFALETLEELKLRIHTNVEVIDFYSKLQILGLMYGKHFQTIRHVWKSAEEVLVELEASYDDKRYMIYPPLLDGVFQALACLTNTKSIYLPVNFSTISYYQPIEKKVIAHMRLTELNDEWLTADITIYQESQISLHIHGFKAHKAGKMAMQTLLQSEGMESWNYEQVWQEYTLLPTSMDAKNSITYDARNDDMPINFATAEELLSYIQDRLSENPDFSVLNIITKNAYVVAEEQICLNQAQLTGFIKTLILEHPQLSIRQIDLETSEDASGILEFVNQDMNGEQILVHRANTWYVPRIVPEIGLSIPLNEYRLVKNESGMLEGLAVVEEETYLPQAGEIVIRPHAVGLNFRDVLNAMNLYPGDPGLLGGDIAGVVSAIGAGVTRFKVGDAVLGLARGSLSSQAISGEALLIAKPPQLSHAAASALPTVFVTAYLALVKLAKLKAGETVLIHAGAGGVGLAAIQLAQYLKVQVIATAGTEDKRAYLRTLGVSYVFDSRNTDFRLEILRVTQNHGVNVVLNSLTGKGFIAASLACCAELGCFIEIGKRDVWTAQEVSQVRPDLAYHIVALDTLAQEHPQQITALLKNVLDLFSQGYLQPLPLNEFGLQQAVAAFKYLQQAQQIGKVIIKLPPVEISFDSHASYLITGGLGGIGLQLAQYLAECGAGRVVLAGRHVNRHATDNVLKENALFEIQECDVSVQGQVQMLIQACHTQDYPLKGIFHLAGIIDDAPINKQTKERFLKVFAPKALGAWNLHEVTQKKNITLDHFVLFSSIASLNGSPGQSNYASANSFLDGLAYYRHHLGLVAQSINWGPWREVGMAKHLVASQERQGIKPLKTAEALVALTQALRKNKILIEIVHANWQVVSERLTQIPTWLLNILKPKTRSSLIQMLELAPPEQREGLLKIAVIQEIRKVLGISATQVISERKGFFEMGMDSLMALELKNRLQALIGYPLSNTIGFDYPTVRSLNKFLITLIDKDKRIASEKEKPMGKSENIAAEDINQMTSEAARLSLQEILNQINIE